MCMNEVTKEVSAGGVLEREGDGARVRGLRSWPAVVLLVLMVGARFVPKFLEGGQSRYWLVTNMGPLLCAVSLLIWWLAASRATWRERVFGFLGVIAALAASVALEHPTMRGVGMVYLTGPMGLFLFGAAAVWLGKRRPMVRTGVALVAAVVGISYSLLLRSDGMNGDYVLITYWRWAESAEEVLLGRGDGGGNVGRSGVDGIEAGRTNEPAMGAVFANAEWPGFRGADRSGRVRGTALARIATDWSVKAPREVWKISVGPAWSSFAVAGRFLFTQEQRGPKEAVVCYDADSGREIWKQEVEARLDDPMGGPGPRATPTLAMVGTNEAGLFVMGGTGILLRLDPRTGEKVWEVNVKEVAGRERAPMWGYAGSPLVTRGVVMVWGGGSGDKGLLGFDVEKGALKWSVGGAGLESYSSPQLNRMAGEELVLVLSEAGLLGVDAASGKKRLNYEFKFNGYRAQQPTVIGDTVLLYTGMNPGTRAVEVKKNGEELVAEELWTARNLRPDFTDFVEYEGHLYGIDGGFMTCVDAKSGERKWRDGRYGKGQVVLLEEARAVLVAAEDGRVALIAANAGEYEALGAFKALEGKTWNHPVVVGNRLYVRNAQEAACYELPMAGGEVKTALRE